MKRFAAALLLVGCHFPAGIAYTPPPPGPALSGLVRRYTPLGFVAAPGVAVSAAGVATTTGTWGEWRLEVPPGTTTIALDGSPAATVVAPLDRVNLAILPLDAPLAGVLADPRGAALPHGTVIATAAALPTGRTEWRADADGYWLGGLAPAPDVRLAAHGTTPGGIPVETRVLATTGGLLRADRARPLGTPTLAAQPGGRATITATGLPTRPDELTVRVDDLPVAWTPEPGGLGLQASPPQQVRLDLLGQPGPTLTWR